MTTPQQEFKSRKYQDGYTTLTIWVDHDTLAKFNELCENSGSAFKNQQEQFKWLIDRMHELPECNTKLDRHNEAVNKYASTLTKKNKKPNNHSKKQSWKQKAKEKLLNLFKRK